MAVALLFCPITSDVKKRALELLTILCEFDEMVFNDVPELMDVVLKVLVKLMLQVPDDSNWESSYDSEEEEESEYNESLYLAAESHLAKLSASSKI